MNISETVSITPYHEAVHYFLGKFFFDSVFNSFMSPYSFSLKLLVCYLKNLVHSGPMNHPLRTNKEKPLINEIETGKDTEGRQILS